MFAEISSPPWYSTFVISALLGPIESMPILRTPGEHPIYVHRATWTSLRCRE